MSITEKQFQYVREEIVADYLGREAQKIYDLYRRLPTVHEYMDITKKANAHAKRLLGK